MSTAVAPSTASGWVNIPGSDRKSTRLNSSHSQISYAVFCLKKKTNTNDNITGFTAHEPISYHKTATSAHNPALRTVVETFRSSVPCSVSGPLRLNVADRLLR